MGAYKDIAIDIDGIVTEALNTVYKDLEEYKHIGYEAMLHAVTKAAADYVNICFDEEGNDYEGY